MAFEDVTRDDALLSQWLGGRSFDACKAEFDEQGYIIFKNVMDADAVERVRAALAPHLVKTGRNDFEGFKSNRVYSLLNKAPEVFSDMVTHPLALAFVEADLGRSCLLYSLLAINLLPGETVQDWHRDDDHISIPFPHPPFGTSTFWAIDDMTEENGATEIIPGSHNWPDKGLGFSKVEDLFDPRERDLDYDPFPRDDAIKVIMPAGSLMVAKATLAHRGGANRSDKPRMIVTPQYCPGWARQLENIVLSTPRDIAAKLPKRTQELIGYSIHGAFMGYVDGRHPKSLLSD